MLRHRNFVSLTQISELCFGEEGVCACMCGKSVKPLLNIHCVQCLERYDELCHVSVREISRGKSEYFKLDWDPGWCHTLKQHRNTSGITYAFTPACNMHHVRCHIFCFDFFHFYNATIHTWFRFLVKINIWKLLQSFMYVHTYIFYLHVIKQWCVHIPRLRRCAIYLSTYVVQMRTMRN